MESSQGIKVIPVWIKNKILSYTNAPKSYANLSIQLMQAWDYIIKENLNLLGFKKRKDMHLRKNRINKKNSDIKKKSSKLVNIKNRQKIVWINQWALIFRYLKVKIYLKFP